ncbi:MAG: peptide chain release factor 1 [bacterium]
MKESLAVTEQRFSELERVLASPESDPEELKKSGKEYSKLKEPMLKFRALKTIEEEIEKNTNLLQSEQDEELKQLCLEEIEKLRRQAEEAEEFLLRWFSGAGENNQHAVILEIRAGTGGEEAALFAGDLFRMYIKYIERKGWKVETLSVSPSSLGGLKEAVFAVKGDRAYETLRHESGVHRVQRVPVTESGGRIHTSAVTVAVLLEPDEIEVQIDPNDLKVDTFRASSAGGQHVNKTDSAVRITHLSTGIVVECQDERSQHQNRTKAMRLLRTRILQKLEAEQSEKISRERRSQVGSGDRSERVRTYNFPQARVTDHRVPITLYKLPLIMEGDLDDLLVPLHTSLTSREIEEKIKK